MPYKDPERKKAHDAEYRATHRAERAAQNRESYRRERAQPDEPRRPGEPTLRERIDFVLGAGDELTPGEIARYCETLPESILPKPR